jgi:hypothetical protein
VVLADGNGRRVAVTGAQGPVVHIVSEDDAIDAELVDQRCCIGGAGQLAGTDALAARSPGRAGEQDADSGQVGKDLVLAS